MGWLRKNGKAREGGGRCGGLVPCGAAAAARGQNQRRDANVDARGALAACPRRHAGAAARSRWLAGGGWWGVGAVRAGRETCDFATAAGSAALLFCSVLDVRQMRMGCMFRCRRRPTRADRSWTLPSPSNVRHGLEFLGRTFKKLAVVIFCNSRVF